MPRSFGWTASQQHHNSRQEAGAKNRNYRPKFCRTRGCSEPFGHPGSCDNVAPSKVEIPAGAGNRRGRRAARRGAGLMGPNHDKLVRRSPKAAPVEAARLGMARIRNHEGSAR